MGPGTTRALIAASLLFVLYLGFQVQAKPRQALPWPVAHHESPTSRGFGSSALLNLAWCLSQDWGEMEKEKEVASPRGVLDIWGRNSWSNKSSIGSSSKGASSSSSTTSNSSGIFQFGKLVKMLKTKSFKRLASFPPRNSKTKGKSINSHNDSLSCTVYDFKSSLVTFTISELVAATNNFSPENLIGRGGFANVYKGALKGGQHIAVKRLTTGTMEEKTESFMSELGILAHLRHPNTAKIIGSCADEGMHLVFKLSPLGSLGSLLHGSNDVVIGWKERYKISLGTAAGLLYLHEGCTKRIIHRDIKSDNILLTKDYVAQIIDFGLAMWMPKQCSHATVSKFEGTFGYFAPEYFMHGIVDDKTDVYAFGVLLLELITGRQALDDLQQSLVIWAKPLLNSNDTKALVDPALGDNYVKEELDRVVLTASLCIEQSPILRPCMSQVTVLLKGGEQASQSMKENRKGLLQRTYSEELLDAEEYNSTKFLQNDLDKLRELAFS